MKVVGVIPARYKSSRFPGKPLANIAGKPMIIHVAEKTAKALGTENTFIATDDQKIQQVVEEYGYKAIMTSEDCKTGTDRLWDFAQKISADIYINVQGDEPMIDPADITKILTMKQDNMEWVINGMSSLHPDESAENINIPKVLVDKNNNLIYMSRLPIPGVKSFEGGLPDYKKQVCIYGFTFDELRKFGSMKEKAEYEKFEDIEILRFFDLGVKVKMVEVNGNTIAVDVPSDIEKVEAIIG